MYSGTIQRTPQHVDTLIILFSNYFVWLARQIVSRTSSSQIAGLLAWSYPAANVLANSVELGGKDKCSDILKVNLRIQSRRIHEEVLP